MAGGDGRGATRRGLLLGAVAAAAGLASACTSSGSTPRPAPTPTPTPPSADQLAAGRAVRWSRALLAQEDALVPAVPRLSSLLGTLVADHREHLVALGLPEPSPSPSASGTTSPTVTGSPSGTSSGGPSPTRTGSPAATRRSPGSKGSGPAVQAAPVAAAEWAAAGEALGDVRATTPGTAGLLARIAAARAVHADLLTAAAGRPPLGPLGGTGQQGTPSPGSSPSGSASPGAASSGGEASATAPSATASATSPDATSPDAAASGDATSGAASSGAESSGAGPSGSTAAPPATLDTDEVAALSALLRGEHAAVFAYGLITARAPAARRKLAGSLWQAHRRRRDELERRLVAAGREPAPAEAAYDVGPAPRTPAALAGLAARVEDGLAAVALEAVTRTAGTMRQEAAADLVRAARRAATWRGTAVPLPGTP